MPRESLISDQLLRDLMAAGQADVLVGLATLNNAATVGRVVAAVMEAFATALHRERTVLLNVDGGSTDGTPEIVRGVVADPSQLVTAAHPLRTVHRISTAYHGVPGRAGALRLIFSAAELLGVKAVVILDPETPALGVAEVARFAEQPLRHGLDFLRPVLPRSPWDGPLVTQLVRPLLRAAFGRRLLEPVDTQMACSGRFATDALRHRVWGLPSAEHGIDLWLSSWAVGNGYRLGQLAIDRTGHVEHGRRLALPELFGQLVATAFECLESKPEAWQGVRGSQEVPILGPGPSPGSARPAVDAAASARAFTAGFPQLRPLLAKVLSPATLAALDERAAGAPVAVEAELWVRTVYEFLAASHHRVMSAGQLAQALVPIYQGRVASFLHEGQAPSPEAGEARLEELAMTFERLKPELIELWNVTAR